ncbi:hypothetical protein [Vacuolonema iberomarrocanum]|uniref:hypothetical protein n=1 Tax=Vacuolonema iberomarrocanum TaxID=3454632 RepID=UPI003F6DF417
MSSAMPPPASSTELPQVFRLSPLVRITLLLLYIALTVPLPFLAEMTQAPVPGWGLAIALSLGAIALYAVLSERVVLSDTAIVVTYPAWVPRFWRKGWSLPWADIKALKPRTTGQGGLVYYFLTQSGEARLLPMRVAGFNRLVQSVQAKTGIDTQDVRPLAQPWMYFILLGFTLLLLMVDTWTIWTVFTFDGGMAGGMTL